jgi:hypothetical protein
VLNGCMPKYRPILGIGAMHARWVKNAGMTTNVTNPSRSSSIKERLKHGQDSKQ